MKSKFLSKLFLPFGITLIIGTYLSAPFPNDSPGCCSVEVNPIIDFMPNATYCDTPDSSSCNEFSINGSYSGSIKKLCPIYFPNSTNVDVCPQTRVATCLVNGYSIKKIYLSTGSTPWDISSATTDCSNLGGTLQ
ncbi:hypothetical protein CH363_07045 [Leptospira haakeii]|uniref:Secreted protein n=1 Tax=Leptospira haakeii TaxID=2023198 RepID=A0ABX4PNT1_9LEPT|nr:hypothetical protein CH363_07045 [Leptospira haakeii]PKA20547.1 hypothetical protein CH377_06450 [Leptospira haakeii]